ncbi:MAG TPA: transcriptional regulator GcvA [Steroidobacteraceae bacterium]|jgi:LysR family glycine cleavage system transcriptional activator|nr:transcriptional regulator GcvA [Steroidobacteraceae bacterium]
MPRSLPPLTSLRAFEAAARSLSFTKAARELHVTPAAISHQIRGLEQFLGVTLFQRTSRRLELTRDGHLAAEHFREAFERIARGVQALRQQGREGELVIGVSPSFATRWLLPRLPSLATDMPEVRVRLVTSTVPVDFDRDDIDLTVRFGRGSFDSVVNDELFNEVVAPVASPAFVRRHQLRRPADLARVRLLQDDSMRRVGRPPSWTEWLRAAGEPGLEIECGLCLDDSHLALQAACEGHGVALGRLAYAVNDLAQNRLVLPFSRVIELDLHYHLVVPEARVKEPLIAGFREWLLREAQEFRDVLAGHAKAA